MGAELNEIDGCKGCDHGDPYRHKSNKDLVFCKVKGSYVGYKFGYSSECPDFKEIVD